MALRTLCKSLWRNPLGPLLLSAQIALSMMILANVAYVIATRLETTGRPTGLDLANIFWISSQGYGKEYNQQRSIKRDLEYLNSLPDVIAACATSAIPQTFTGFQTTASTDSEVKAYNRSVLLFQMTERSIETLGVHLIKGRGPSPDFVVPASIGSDRVGPEVIITGALAVRLYGSAEEAIGKSIYFGGEHRQTATVGGIVERLQAAPFFLPGTEFVNEVVVAPAIPAGPDALYLVRTKPGSRDQVLRRVRNEFEALERGRYVDKIDTLANTAAESRADDRNSAVVLAILATIVLVVTMLGLFGFAAFSVTARTKEIGTRRAIGATRTDIVNQFLLENWIITTGGLALGSILTMGFALQLSMLLEMPRLPFLFLVGSMVGIWSAGLVAAYLPALKAAQVSPAVATRAA